MFSQIEKAPDVAGKSSSSTRRRKESSPRESTASRRNRRKEEDAEYVDPYGRVSVGGGGDGHAADRKAADDDDDDDDDYASRHSSSRSHHKNGRVYDEHGRLVRSVASVRPPRTNRDANLLNDAMANDNASTIAASAASIRRNRERERYLGDERTPERWAASVKDEKRRRSRSRSPAERESSRSARGGDRDRGGRARDDDRSRRRGSGGSGRKSRSRSPRPSKRERTPDSPVLNEEERDQRTVFVMQLSQRVTAWDLEEFFSSVGNIRDVRLIVDGRTKRSKGIAYIEFRDLESVPLAIGLNGQKLRGVPIKVQASHAERNRAAEAAAAMVAASAVATGTGTSPTAFPPPPVTLSAATAAAIAEAHGPPTLANMQVGSGRPYIPRHLRKQQAIEAAAKATLAAKTGTDKPMRIYVGSLHFSITEDDLRAIFEPFGHLQLVSLVRDAPTGRSRGYAFLTYRRQEDARAAMEQMNGFDLAGRQIKVSHVNEKGPDAAEPTDRLDVEEGRGGISMTGTNRLALMAKLAEGTGLAIPDHLKATLDQQKQAQEQKAAAYHQLQQSKLQAQQEARAAAQQAAHTQSNDVPEYATQCILLSNMFDPVAETGDEWHEEIRDDVISECLKHGGCVHAYVDRDSKEGNVYAKCPSVAMAVATVKAMNGRHYGGRVVQANYVPVAHYNQLFHDSIRATVRLQPRDAVVE